jgi:predicted nucleotidyltransferase
MHPGLEESLNRLQAHFTVDKRCVAMYLWGSLGAGTADAFSDVDVALVVNDDAYEAVRNELRTACEALCGPILVWLPEGETPDCGNYAFVFEREGEQLLYDFYLSKASHAAKGPGTLPKCILFDHAGLLSSKPEPAAPSSPPPIADALLRSIDNYWVYMYLNGKYFRRGDLYKMLYVQDVLFQTHLNVLFALKPEVRRIWWAKDIRYLSEARQQDLMVYFGATDLPSLSSALAQEIAIFSEDAQAACRHFDLPYPAALERGVRQHLRTMGVLLCNA